MVDDPGSVGEEHRAPEVEYGAGALSGQRRERAVKRTGAARLHESNLHAQRWSSSLRLFHLDSVDGLGGIPEDGYPGEVWNCLLEELQTFAG